MKRSFWLAWLVFSTIGVCWASPVQWSTTAGGNGHWYEAFTGTSGLTWTIADQQAHARGGYLATITSPAENAFVFSLVNSPDFFNGPSNNGSGPALGGIQTDGASEPGSGWHWNTGEAWSYTNWLGGQPDNGMIWNENRLHFWGGQSGIVASTWNDIGENDENLGGYVIEWTSVPEPSSILALLSGLGGIGGMVWFKRKS